MLMVIVCARKRTYTLSSVIVRRANCNGRGRCPQGYGFVLCEVYVQALKVRGLSMSVYHQDVKKRVSKERTTRPPRVHTPSTIAGRAIHAPDSGGLSHASASPELFRATGQGLGA